MQSLADMIRQWAIEDGAEHPVIKIDNEPLRCEYTFQDTRDEETFQAYLNGYETERSIMLSLYPGSETIPSDRHSAVALLLSMVNNRHLKVGNFEIAKDGRVRYRNTIHISGKKSNGSSIQAIIAEGMDHMAIALPLIRQVAFAKMSPEVVMAAHENEQGTLPASEIEDVEALPWKHFPGSEAIQRWAVSVRSALAAVDTSEDTWRMIGPAIGIEHHFLRIGESLCRRIAAECGIPLHVVEADSLSEAAANLRAIEKSAPVLVFIESGTWQTQKSDKEEDDQEGRGHVLALMKVFNPAHPVLVVTITDGMSKLAAPLKRERAFDRWFSLPAMTAQALGDLVIEMVGPERCADSITAFPAKVGKLMDISFDGPEVRKLGALRLRRIHAEVGRALEFIDLVDMQIHGILESGSLPIEDVQHRNWVAWHEAGHVAMSILDSDGRNIPEFASILPKCGYYGVVVESVEFNYAYKRKRTYSEFRHSILTRLGGRAAEEVAYGAANISTGCSADLQSCYWLARRAFAEWGFAPGMEHADADSSINLAVVVGDPTPSEYAHVETIVRDFLADQYRLVLTILKANRRLLEAIQLRLVKNTILDQQEITELYANFSQTPVGTLP